MAPFFGRRRKDTQGPVANEPSLASPGSPPPACCCWRRAGPHFFPARVGKRPSLCNRSYATFAGAPSRRSGNGKVTEIKIEQSALDLVSPDDPTLGGPPAEELEVGPRAHL